MCSPRRPLLPTGADATSRIDDKFKNADAQLRQGVFHLLRKEYQKAYV